METSRPAWGLFRESVGYRWSLAMDTELDDTNREGGSQ